MTGIEVALKIVSVFQTKLDGLVLTHIEPYLVCIPNCFSSWRFLNPGGMLLRKALWNPFQDNAIAETTGLVTSLTNGNLLFLIWLHI